MAVLLQHGEKCFIEWVKLLMSHDSSDRQSGLNPESGQGRWLKNSNRLLDLNSFWAGISWYQWCSARSGNQKSLFFVAVDIWADHKNRLRTQVCRLIDESMHSRNPAVNDGKVNDFFTSVYHRVACVIKKSTTKSINEIYLFKRWEHHAVNVHCIYWHLRNSSKVSVYQKLNAVEVLNWNKI